ncbi:MAG: dihydroneopterin aldolase [Euryarchaeota archaeon]|nr:dihydroneopterin aldolase [Euryarchaeota archaeon]
MGKHGAYDFEHQEEQPFVVSIWVELRNSSFDDKLENTINYAELQSLVDRVIIDSPPIRLMETMMVKITESIKQNPLVSKINIRIEKPKAALPKDGGLAIVESQWPY